MSTITLDELTLTHQTNKAYIVSAHYNKQLVGAVNAKKDTSVTPENTELKHDIKDSNLSPAIKPILDSFDFNALTADLDLLDIILLHEITDTANKTIGKNYIANHVAINDTKYPPPYNSRNLADIKRMAENPSPHKILTDKFTLKVLEIKRDITNPKLFNVSIILTINSGIGDYKAGITKGKILTDNFNQSHNAHMSAMVLHVEPISPAGANEIEFDIQGVELGQFYGFGGLPIVVAEEGFQWLDIEWKKGAISIK